MILTALSRRDLGYRECAKLDGFFLATTPTFAPFTPNDSSITVNFINELADPVWVLQRSL
jgi:hypothetical protein